MVDGADEVSVDLAVETDGFALGLQAGMMLAGSGRDEAAACDGCTCGLADGETREVPLGTDPDRGSLGEFHEEFRALLEFYFPEIDEDTIVGKVEICADDVPVAHVRE